MQRKTVVRIVMEIKANYRYTYRDMSDQEMQIMIARWYDCLSGYTDEQVEGAFRTALCKLSVPPTIADIVGIIDRQEKLKEPSDIELWSELTERMKECCAQVWTACGFRSLAELKTEKARAIYDTLSEPIKAYIGFDSFCDIAGCNAEQLQFERARFLKAIPEIRVSLRERKMITKSKPMISGGQGIGLLMAKGEKHGS